MGAHAAGLCAATSVRQIQRGPRGGGLPERARVRCGRRCAHHAHAQGGSEADGPGARRRKQDRAAAATTLRAPRASLRDASGLEEEGGCLMGTSTLNHELVSALKRLKLGPIAETLPDRLVLADKQEMSFD